MQRLADAMTRDIRFAPEVMETVRAASGERGAVAVAVAVAVALAVAVAVAVAVAPTIAAYNRVSRVLQTPHLYADDPR